MDCSTLGFPVHHQLPELTQTHVHWVGNVIQPSYPLSSPPPPAFDLFQHQCLLNESVLLIRWPKYWSFSFIVSHSNEYSELISFRMDWLDLCAVQGNLKSLLQHHSSRTSVLRHSAFFPWTIYSPWGRKKSDTTEWIHFQFSLQSNSHIHTRLLEKPELWLDGPLSAV